MNRIYLKPRKNKKNAFWVKDILDGKKLGKLSAKNNKLKIKLKSKYKSYSLKQEALFTLNKAWQDFYEQFIFDYNQTHFDTRNYDLPLFVESLRLTPSNTDMFQRPTLLHPATNKAWQKMKKAALIDNIELQMVSAYRSLDYQKQLINNKLDKGIDINTILKVNTLPGYSEHHTGCAIDIGCQGEPILEEAFDKTAAFKWLNQNANKFNFYMSYPKGNTTGICYEPWHWCFKPLKAISP